MGNKPKVTVITVTYNCVNDIEATLLSVLSQDYPELEYIVVDGKSTDGTLDIIRKYGNRITKFVSEPDKGLYDAMNKGIRMATGQWCAFMNAGDAYTDNHTISSLFADIAADSDRKVVYGNTIYIERDGSSHLHDTSDLEHLDSTISRYQPYTHQAVFYNIMNKEDCLYNPAYRIAADYDVACRYWNKYGKNAYHYVPIAVCTYKAYDGISSKPTAARLLRKDYLCIKIRHHMGVLEILKDVVRYVSSGIKEIMR